MIMKERTRNYLKNFFKDNFDLFDISDKILDAVITLVNCAQNNKILVCGNGGSAADSEHIAGELLKSFCLKRKVNDEFKEKMSNAYGEKGLAIAEGLQQGVKCIPLTSFCGYNTAWLNDCNPEYLYAQLVNGLGESGDVLIAISTSGNSKNVCDAAMVAKQKDMKVIAFTGQTGGKLRELSDVLLNVPSTETYKIQELHIKVYHLLCLCIESEMFDE